jgi:hypothetical protein
MNTAGPKQPDITAAGAGKPRRGRRALYLAAGLAAALVVAANLAANSSLGGMRAGDRPAAPATTTATGPARQTWSPTPAAPRPHIPPTASPATNDTHNEDDHQLGDPGTDPHTAATITDGPADPADAALTFSSIWISTYGKSPEQWRASLIDARPPLVTPDLARLLADADPASVPTGTLTAARATAAGDALQRVAMTVVGNTSHRPSGTLTVTVTGASGRWLTSEIDWEPAR